MHALQLAGAMALSYFVLVLNTRAIARGSYLGVAGTDLAIASVNFFVVQRVASASSSAEFVGYVLGGTSGALVALYVSKRQGW